MRELGPRGADVRLLVLVSSSLLLCCCARGRPRSLCLGREACLLGVAGGALEAQCSPSKHLISELSLVTDPGHFIIGGGDNNNKHNNTAPRLHLVQCQGSLSRVDSS